MEQSVIVILIKIGLLYILLNLQITFRMRGSLEERFLHGVNSLGKTVFIKRYGPVLHLSPIDIGDPNQQRLT